jgi:hypothetical protein
MDAMPGMGGPPLDGQVKGPLALAQHGDGEFPARVSSREALDEDLPRARKEAGQACPELMGGCGEDLSPSPPLSGRLEDDGNPVFAG